MGIQVPSVDKSKIATACGIQTTEDAENLEIGKTMWAGDQLGNRNMSWSGLSMLYAAPLY